MTAAGWLALALIVAVLPLTCYALAAGIESDRRRYGRHTSARRAAADDRSNADRARYLADGPPPDAPPPDPAAETAE